MLIQVKMCSGTSKYLRRLIFLDHSGSCHNDFNMPQMNLTVIGRITAWPVRMRVCAEEVLRSKMSKLLVFLMTSMSLNLSFLIFFHIFHIYTFLRFLFLPTLKKTLYFYFHSYACVPSENTWIVFTQHY